MKPWLTHLKWHNIISFREENLNAPLSNNHEQRKPNNLAKVLKRAEIRPNIRVDKEIRFGQNWMLIQLFGFGLAEAEIQCQNSASASFSLNLHSFTLYIWVVLPSHCKFFFNNKKSFRKIGFNPVFRNIFYIMKFFLFALKLNIWVFTNPNNKHKSLSYRVKDDSN